MAHYVNSRHYRGAYNTSFLFGSFQCSAIIQRWNTFELARLGSDVNVSGVTGFHRIRFNDPILYVLLGEIDRVSVISSAEVLTHRLWKLRRWINIHFCAIELI